VNKIAKGFRWAKREHIWENHTNKAIVIGLTTTGLGYYYHLYPAELGLSFLLLIGFTHLIARISHKMEQHYLRDMRRGK